MHPEEVHLLSELDRSEHVTQCYKMNQGSMECIDVNWDIPQWVIEEKLEEWAPVAEGFNNMWGAFQHGRLAGFVIYRRHLTEETAQLALLHVSRDFRGEGIGTMLINRALEKAVEDGKKSIYVSSCPTRNTVDFYMGKGFRIAAEPNMELFEMEPEDIHMVMEVK